MVEEFLVAARNSSPSAIFFTVPHGLPTDCVPNCVRMSASGLMVNDRIGWIVVNGTDQLRDASHLIYFDVHAEDGVILNRHVIRQLSSNLLFHTFKMFAEDPDTPAPALITIAAHLDSQEWKDIGEVLLANETARTSCDVLSHLSKLKRPVYREIQKDAAALLGALAAEGKC